jgi:hypothetical protein
MGACSVEIFLLIMQINASLVPTNKQTRLFFSYPSFKEVHMFFGTWKPNVAQRPRQNTMYQTPLDIGTLMGLGRIVKSGWSLRLSQARMTPR